MVLAVICCSCDYGTQTDLMEILHVILCKLIVWEFVCKMKMVFVYFLIFILRLLLFIFAHIAACIPFVNNKYKVKQRLRGPWIPVNCSSHCTGKSSVPHLWLHGASLGECRMLLSLAKALKEDLPDCPEIFLTTQKAEAIAPLKKTACEICDVTIAPADLPWTLKNFADEVKPVALILGENELWPGYISLMKNLKKSYMPYPSVALVSGRIYKYPPWVNLSELGFVTMQKDGGNWKLLPWARSGIAVEPPQKTTVDFAFISFHKEELPAFCELAAGAISINYSVVLAPRRLEEAELFCNALKALKIQILEWPSIKKSAVTVVKKFGVVSEILKVSRASVVGGSFDKRLKIHDFWEPLCAGVQTFVGPYSRGAEGCDALIQAGALVQIEKPVQLLNASANISAIKTALHFEREKILNSYGQLLKFLLAIYKEPAL